MSRCRTKPVPRLAAVIVNFRTPEATAAAVRSLRGSRRPVQDIIVVENGSGDGSAAALQEMLPDVTVIVSDANRGFAGGCNLGIDESLKRDAAAVFLLNSDAVVDEGCLGVLERELVQRADCGIVGALVLRQTARQVIESRGIVVRPWLGRVKLRDFGRRAGSVRLPACEPVAAVSGCAMLIRREVFERIGLLSEDYFWGLEDVDYCLAAGGAGFGVYVANEAVVRHQGSLSIGRRSAQRVYWATRNHLLLLDRRWPLPWLPSIGRRLVVVGLNLAYAVTAPGVPRVRGVMAVLRGVWRYLGARAR